MIHQFYYDMLMLFTGNPEVGYLPKELEGSLTSVIDNMRVARSSVQEFVPQDTIFTKSQILPDSGVVISLLDQSMSVGRILTSLVVDNLLREGSPSNTSQELTEQVNRLNDECDQVISEYGLSSQIGRSNAMGGRESFLTTLNTLSPKKETFKRRNLESLWTYLMGMNFTQGGDRGEDRYIPMEELADQKTIIIAPATSGLLHIQLLDELYFRREGKRMNIAIALPRPHTPSMLVKDYEGFNTVIYNPTEKLLGQYARAVILDDIVSSGDSIRSTRDLIRANKELDGMEVVSYLNYYDD